MNTRSNSNDSTTNYPVNLQNSNNSNESSGISGDNDEAMDDDDENNSNNNTKKSNPLQPQQQQLFVMDSYNIHRLIISGITVASKFFSDVFYKNSRYAKVGGLPLEELNNLEVQFLLLLDFNLMIQVEEMYRYGDLLLKFWKREQIKQQAQQQNQQQAQQQAHERAQQTQQEVQQQQQQQEQQQEQQQQQQQHHDSLTYESHEQQVHDSNNTFVQS
ncbi:unnamed protein product [[Candida] boidinii]|nr:unnamed protein product [[Candida] boidinii]